MDITITVPEMKCSKCETSAPIQPSVLYFRERVPSQFQALVVAVAKEGTDARAVDSLGRSWEILADEKPVGWMRGPRDNYLCGPCGALWTAAQKAFLEPPPPPAPVVELAPMPEPFLAVAPAVAPLRSSARRSALVTIPERTAPAAEVSAQVRRAQAQAAQAKQHVKHLAAPTYSKPAKPNSFQPYTVTMNPGSSVPIIKGTPPAALTKAPPGSPPKMVAPHHGSSVAMPVVPPAFVPRKPLPAFVPPKPQPAGSYTIPKLNPGSSLPAPVVAQPLKRQVMPAFVPPPAYPPPTAGVFTVPKTIPGTSVPDTAPQIRDPKLYPATR